MKKLINGFIALLFISFAFQNVHAQTENEATFKAYLKNMYDAYQGDNADAMWAYYTENGAEIGPDGHLSNGKAALKAGWDAFMKMVDGKPSFTYELTSWRLISPEVALLTWNSTADIKILGQQVGGPTTCAAVLHKINGKWMVEFDTMTPIMPPPMGGN